MFEHCSNVIVSSTSCKTTTKKTKKQVSGTKEKCKILHECYISPHKKRKKRRRKRTSGTKSRERNDKGTNSLAHKRNKGVCHTVALPFTFKSILRQKKNYGNSNISPCKNNIIFEKKTSKRNQNPSRYYNSITNIEFQLKPKYHLSKILI